MMADTTSLLELDTESRDFLDFLETSGYIGPVAVEPMSETKLGDLYKLLFQAVRAGAKSFNFRDIFQHMTSHDLLRLEGHEWLFPTKAISVPCLEPCVAGTCVEPKEKQSGVELPEKQQSCVEIQKEKPCVDLSEKQPCLELPEKQPCVEPQEKQLETLPCVDLSQKQLCVEIPEKQLSVELQPEKQPCVEGPEKQLCVELPEALPSMELPEKQMCVDVGEKQPCVELPKKQTRRLTLDPRLTKSSLRRLLEARKDEPLSFLSANILQGYGDNGANLLEKANYPAVVFLSNTGLEKEVKNEDIIWSGYSRRSYRRSYEGEQGDLLLYYAAHLKVEHLLDLQSEQTDMIWVKLTGYRTIENNKGTKEPALIMGNIYDGKVDSEDFLQSFSQNLEIIKERFGDVDVVVQGSVEGRDDGVKGLVGKTGLITHEAGGGNILLTSPGLAIRSVEEVTAFKAVLAHMESTRCDLCQVEFRKYEELKKHKNTARHHCDLCQVEFRKYEEMKEHMNTARHHRNYCYILYQRKREEMLKSPNCFGLEMEALNGDLGVEMSQDEPGLVTVKTSPGLVKNFSVSMKNVAGETEQLEDGSKACIVIQAIDFLRTDPAFTVTDKYEVSNRGRGEVSIRISSGMSYKAKVTCLADQRGHYKVPLVVTFYHDIRSKKVIREDEEHFELSHMALEVLLIVQTDEMQELQPQAPYHTPKPVKRWSLKNAERAPRPPWVEEVSGEEEKQNGAVKLKYYEIPEVRYNLLSHGMEIWKVGFTTTDRHEIGKCHQILAGNLNPENYRERLELLLQFEEHQMKQDIRHYDMAAVEIVKRNQLLQLKVPGVLEKRPSVMKGDRLFIRQTGGGPQYEAIVQDVFEEWVQLACSDKLINSFINGSKFDVRFTVNRLSLRSMHRAIDMAEDKGIVPALFPTQAQLKNISDLPDIQPMDRQLADNPEQMLAVKNIVAGSSGSAPYLVFGPPGTGKTVTMVEAIKQINRLEPNSKILATAPSNAAADLLASRLIKHVPHSQLLRLHAPSRSFKSIPEDILDVSYVEKGSGKSFSYPAAEELTKYRVLVVTLVTADRLVSSGFPKGHFSHVFIDEAGQATEPEALIALAGILDKETIGKTCLVLAGDPKQLGPVLRSQWSIKHGLDVSLLERLFNEDMYKVNEKLGYDNRCITKLVRNFRSHEKLLKIPSNLFYCDELETAADELEVNSLLQWPSLKKKGFPFIFHGIIGQDLREENSPSFFNLEEVCTVVDYIEDLLSTREFGIRVSAKEIGVISPYRRQVLEIRARLAAKHINDVTVGSTEEFQGQERRVIIMSTVSSRPQFVAMDEKHKLGFLRNPKRFNVSITRAKALLIVVGNPHILSLDSNWKALINYAVEEGGYAGCPYSEENDDAMNAMATRLAGILDVKEEEREDGVSQRTAVEEPQWRAEH